MQAPHNVLNTRFVQDSNAADVSNNLKQLTLAINKQLTELNIDRFK